MRLPGRMVPRFLRCGEAKLPRKLLHPSWIVAAAEREAVLGRELATRRHDEAELLYRATYDALTGLPNRTLLLDRLRQALALSARAARVPALLYIDLDQFKEVNDSLGHEACDQLLRAVAQRLASMLRPGDTLARLDGDEFLVLLPDLARAEDAAAVSHKLIEADAAPYELAGRQLYCSCSIGVAPATDATPHPLTLIQRADLAMHEAKRVGRSNVQCYVDGLAVRAGERLEMRTQLQAAIARREFTLEYQPQMDLATQRVCGVEALLRWRHPTLGTTHPTDSSRWPRRPVRSAQSATGCSTRPAASSAIGSIAACSTACWRSTSRACSSGARVSSSASRTRWRAMACPACGSNSS